MKESKYLCSVEGLNLWKVPRLFPLHINHMTKDIKIFENPDFGQVRTTTGENGTPFFCAVDVCRALGYGNSREALRKHVMEDDVTKRDTIDSLGRKQHTSFINESGFYALVFSSKLPKAREFKHWVTSEVLPQIRNTGGYIPVSQQDDEKMILCKALNIMKRTIEQKDELIESQKPKVLFADAVTACDDSILIRDLAKLITQNGINIGQNRLFYWLRLNGYLFKRETRPIQKWVEQGLFETSVSLIETHHGTMERCTTKVTGKGQQYFVNGFVTGRFKADNQNL